MNNANNQLFVIEPACDDDSEEINQILEEELSPGNLSLLFTRRPNAYQSMQKEGEKIEVVVCRNSFNSEIIGIGAYAINSGYIDNKIQPFAYLFALRVRNRYRNKAARAILKTYQYIKEKLEKDNIDVVLTTILDTNYRAKNLLTKSHKNMPSYEYLGDYEVYSIKTGVQNRCYVPAYVTLKSIKQCDANTVAKFIEAYGSRYNFFPAIKADDLNNNPLFRDYYILVDNTANTILAAGLCWDQQAYKQIKIVSYHGFYRFLYPFSNLLSMIGYPRLPKAGAILNYFTLSFWLVRDNNPEYYKWFISAISEKTLMYDFYCIGVAERHPLRNTIRKARHWLYKSKIYAVSWSSKIPTKVKLDANRSLYLECGKL